MKQHLTPSEHTALWNSFREGSSDAYSRLYDLFAGDLYRYGYHLVRNRQLVEDCLHELFLHLHESRLRLGPTDNIQYYLFRAIRRRLLDTVNRLNKFESDDFEFPDAQFQAEPYEHTLIEREGLDRQREMVYHAIDTLPRRQKEIIYLVYTKGLNYQQAADTMGISIKSVYNTINIALSTLRTYIHETFGFGNLRLDSFVLWIVLSCSLIF